MSDPGITFHGIVERLSKVGGTTFDAGGLLRGC